MSSSIFGVDRVSPATFTVSPANDSRNRGCCCRMFDYIIWVVKSIWNLFFGCCCPCTIENAHSNAATVGAVTTATTVGNRRRGPALVTNNEMPDPLIASMRLELGPEARQVAIEIPWDAINLPNFDNERDPIFNVATVRELLDHPEDPFWDPAGAAKHSVWEYIQRLFLPANANDPSLRQQKLLICAIMNKLKDVGRLDEVRPPTEQQFGPAVVVFFNRILQNGNLEELLSGLMIAAHPLFNVSYVRSLCTTQNHPDWQYAGGNYGPIRRFFNELITNQNTRQLTEANRTRLKLAVCAIMNKLQGMRRLDADLQVNQQQFPREMRTIFDRIKDSLTHCSNNVNPTFESILIDVLSDSPEGTLEYRVKTKLQQIRKDCLQGAITNVVDRGSESDQTHEAASTNYYFKRCYQAAGLPRPSSVLDPNYEGCARQGCDAEVVAEFNRLYTIQRMLDTLYPAIGDPNDRSIPCRLFLGWVERSGRSDGTNIIDPATRRPITDASGRNIPMMDQNGYFQKQLILEFLLEKRILQQRGQS